MIRRPPRSTLILYTTLFFFFFNDTATTEIYTLSLHDALPICAVRSVPGASASSTNCCGARSIARGSNTAKKLGSSRAQFTSRDRKSTRLNSSHANISYAVFCLKKKKHTTELQSRQYHVCLLLH